MSNPSFPRPTAGRLSLPLWQERYAAPLAPTTRAEMAARGWDAVDVVFVSGDAYVDHPSFAAAILHRSLERAGFRVAVLSQPVWRNCEPWREFGRPRLFYAVSAGNMDSMINHYTANKKVRNDDAYSPGGRIGLRPDRATLVYCQRAREAYPGVPVIAGGVEASLRRLAHYDYWSDTVKRSIVLDSKADLVAYGMGEKSIVEIARRLAAGGTVKDLRDLRGVTYALGAKESTELASGSGLVGRVESARPDAAARVSVTGHDKSEPALDRAPDFRPNGPDAPRQVSKTRPDLQDPNQDLVFLPTYEQVRDDKLAFAEATRVIHTNTNPFNAVTLVQFHDRQAVVQTPPAEPLTQAE
ncbi:MAG TPA: hypothetical protein VH092_35750, partial [Urbifossiella sp.]|nr:hypothetical protein [Urbifossiella sp.]